MPAVFRTPAPIASSSKKPVLKLQKIMSTLMTSQAMTQIRGAVPMLGRRDGDPTLSQRLLCVG